MKTIIIGLLIVGTAFVGYYLFANASQPEAGPPPAENPTCPCSQGK